MPRLRLTTVPAGTDRIRGAVSGFLLPDFLQVHRQDITVNLSAQPSLSNVWDITDMQVHKQSDKPQDVLHVTIGDVSSRGIISKQ